MSALLDFVSRATVMAQVSVVHPLTQVSLKLLHGSRPNFAENYLYAISWDLFLLFFFRILHFQTFIWFFFRFHQHRSQCKPTFQTATFPTVSVWFQPNFMMNMIVTGEHIIFWDLPEKKKKIWHIEIVLIQGLMELKISKLYSYIFHLMSAKLWGLWLPWWNTGCYYGQVLKKCGTLKF